MMKIVPMSLIAGLLSVVAPLEKHKLSIKVEGITDVKGNLGILLFNSAEGYPEEWGKALKSYSIKVEGKTMVIDLGEFPKGQYAVTLMQDKNANGVMDKNFIGIPKEPFGFTKLKEVPFGTPSFEETSIELSDDSQELIKLLEF